MAKYAVILSVIFSLFLLSNARIPSYLHDASVTDTTPLSTIDKNDDDKTTLLHLPTFKSDEILKSDEIGETIAAVGVTRPLTLPFDGRFRTVNRHFPRPRPDGHRPFPHHCGGHRHRQGGGEHRVHVRFGDEKIGDVMRQIPYGDDMIGFDGHRIQEKEFRFHGDRRVDEEEEEGGFMRWFWDMLNRF